MLVELDVFVLPVVLVLAAPPVLLDALPVVLEEPLVPPDAVPDAGPFCVGPEEPDVPD
jgi:hypothetical protein